jgi:hypothetical protein
VELDAAEKKQELSFCDLNEIQKEHEINLIVKVKNKILEC